MSDIEVEEFKLNIKEDDNEKKIINIDTLDYKPTPKSINDMKVSIKDTRKKILNDIVLPSYYYDVDSIMKARTLYRLGANYTELFSKVLTGISSVIAFASGVYPEYSYLSFIAGSVGTVAIVCQQFSTYFNKEEKERTEQANTILRKFGVGVLPDIDQDQNV